MLFGIGETAPINGCLAVRALMELFNDVRNVGFGATGIQDPVAMTAEAFERFIEEIFNIRFDIFH